MSPAEHEYISLVHTTIFAFVNSEVVESISPVPWIAGEEYEAAVATAKWELRKRHPLAEIRVRRMIPEWD